MFGKLQNGFPIQDFGGNAHGIIAMERYDYSTVMG
jgi:hypothetical protein